VLLSIYVIADLDTEDGLSTVRAALAFSVRRVYPFTLTYLIWLLAKSSASAQSRLTFLHNSALPISDPGRYNRVSSLFSHLIYKDILSKLSPSDLLRAIDSPDESRQGGQALLGMPSSLDEKAGGITFVDVDKGYYRWFVEASGVAAKRVGLSPGTSGLIINGRVRFPVSFPVSNCDVPRLQIVGPIAPGEFTAEDYQTLQDYELARRVQPVLSALDDVVPAFTGHDR
jgi:UDP-glucose:glycoprotein glucosyltransferase